MQLLPAVSHFLSTARAVLGLLEGVGSRAKGFPCHVKVGCVSDSALLFMLHGSSSMKLRHGVPAGLLNQQYPKFGSGLRVARKVFPSLSCQSVCNSSYVWGPRRFFMDKLLLRSCRK